MATVTAIQSSTVRGKYSAALAFAEQMREMIEANGLTVEGQAIAMTLKQYGGQEIEVAEGEVIVLSAENFDTAIRTESDRLAVKAADILKDFEGRAAPLLAQLKVIWTEAEAALMAEDDRLALPDLPEFAHKSGRRGGAGGGGVKKVPDFNPDEYKKRTQSGAVYTMIVEGRDNEGIPTSFAVLGPNNEVIEGLGDDDELTTSFKSVTKAKNAACGSAGLNPQVNARLFWGINEAK
jgi:hypothetical protein